MSQKLDKSRIQGFGIQASQCPEGHELQPWEARSGTCDGCAKMVRYGEIVMDCRRCDWYLCRSCLPASRIQESSIWGTISSLPFYAMEDAAELANELLSEVWGDTSTSTLHNCRPVPPAPLSCSNKELERAAKLVNHFCDNYPAARLAPNGRELDCLWDECRLCRYASVADALVEQLSWASGDHAWQPKLRVLYVLEHFHAKNGVARNIAMSVSKQANALLEHLVEIPQCQLKALQIIRQLKGENILSSRMESSLAETDSADGNAADDESDGIVRSASALEQSSSQKKKTFEVDLIDVERACSLTLHPEVATSSAPSWLLPPPAPISPVVNANAAMCALIQHDAQLESATPPTGTGVTKPDATLLLDTSAEASFVDKAVPAVVQDRNPQGGPLLGDKNKEVSRPSFLCKALGQKQKTDSGSKEWNGEVDSMLRVVASRLGA